MPTKWTGTVEERYARLDQAQRRCDGNSRHCTHSATTRYTLAPAKDGHPIPGEQQVTRLSCSRHIPQFTNSARYVVVETSRLAVRPAGKAHPHTIY